MTTRGAAGSAIIGASRASRRDPRGQTRGLRVRRHDEHARAPERRRSDVRAPAGRASVPQTLATTVTPRARAPSIAGEQLAGGIGMRAVAEHDVEQDHGRGGIVRLARDPFAADGPVDHRVRAAHGVHVVAEVDDAVPGAAGAPSHLAEPCPQERRRFLRERAARVDAADVRVARASSRRGARDQALDVRGGEREVDRVVPLAPRERDGRERGVLQRGARCSPSRRR